MIPTLLITLREVIEASLVVATILGMLTKLGQTNRIRTMWFAAISALIVSFLFVTLGSFLGVRIQRSIENPGIEGFFLILSAFFVTWAVFTLHTQFAQNKVHMLANMKQTIAENGIFLFTFIAVFREGVEIILFLSTMYLTTTPITIVTGFMVGIIGGLAVSLLFFTATIRLPMYWAFRATSYLLILSAGGFLAQGVAEFSEMGILPHVATLQLAIALTYIYFMHRKIFVTSSGIDRSRCSSQAPEAQDRAFLSGHVNRY